MGNNEEILSSPLQITSASINFDARLGQARVSAAGVNVLEVALVETG